MIVHSMRHFQTGDVRTVGSFIWAPVGCFLFGWIYFLFRGNWIHFIGSFIIQGLTLNLSQLVYPFFVFRINERHLRDKGYVEDKEAPTPDSSKKTIGFLIFGFLVLLEVVFIGIVISALFNFSQDVELGGLDLDIQSDGFNLDLDID